MNEQLSNTVSDVATQHELPTPTAVPLENGQSLTIRAAALSDHAAAVELFRAQLGASFALEEALWREVCQSPNAYRVFVGETDDGKIVGLAVVVVSDRIRLSAGTRRRRFHLDQLITLPAMRRQGVGHALITALIDMAKHQAPSYIIVNCDFTDVAARKTYESAGLNLVRQSADRFEIAFSE